MAEIVVIGGGVAGLSAARALSPFHRVRVVEGTDSLGGVGGTLSCKAGDGCSVCTACTLPELVEDVLTDPNITVERGTTLDSVLSSHPPIALRGAGDRHEGSTYVVATGHTITDGSMVSEYGTHLDGVVTALDMDRMLRSAGEGTDELPIPQGEGSVGLIQCVCSRDTDELPYCSRVCCAYTARLALEIRRLRPRARVTVFYMDLQREDRVAARQIDVAMADPGIEYIRSRPASVQACPDGRLEVLYEDTLKGEITTSDQDMVVLSTGLEPSEGTRQAARLLDLETDEYGFIATDPKDPSATSREGVYVAGGASGPVDLVEAAMGGMAAAASILSREPPEWPGHPPRVIVVGGWPAAEAADEAARAAGADTSLVEGAPGGGLKRLDGEPGAFIARTGRTGGGPTIDLEGDLVIVAPDVGDGAPTGLGGAVTLESLGKDVGTGTLEEGGRYALVMGNDGSALTLASAIMDGRADARVDVLLRDMMVAGSGMQELQLDLANRGVGFHRYAARSLRVDGDGPFQVSFVDEMSPELGALTLTVDSVAASPEGRERGLVWPWFLSRHAPEGVPPGQRLNVLPVQTPRRGVYTTVPAGGTSVAAVLGGPAAAAMAMADFARGFPLMEEVAVVDPDLCAACLNCLRTCPHDAIVFDEEARAAVVMPRACQDCGLCRGMCPAGAIELVPSDQLEVD